MNPMFTQQIVAGNVSPVVIDWIYRVQKNGGAKPGQNTISAVNHLYKNLATTTILGKIKSLNCYVPDNLIAAITPLINTYGKDPWLNNNNQFVIGDLTINGLKGNGSDQFSPSLAKLLDTGVSGSNYSNDNTAGITIYAYTTGLSADAGTYEAGYTNDDGSDGASLSFHDNNANIFRFWAFNLNNGGCLFNSTGSGYLSGNRISSTDMRMYFANTFNAHSQVAINTGLNTGTRAAHNIFVHAAYHWNAGSLYEFGASPSRISFAAIHDGLTGGESSQFFSFIQSYRKQIGGGWV
jgi:hypothetical protein